MAGAIRRACCTQGWLEMVQCRTYICLDYIDDPVGGIGNCAAIELRVCFLSIFSFESWVLSIPSSIAKVACLPSVYQVHTFMRLT